MRECSGAAINALYLRRFGPWVVIAHQMIDFREKNASASDHAQNGGHERRVEPDHELDALPLDRQGARVVAVQHPPGLRAHLFHLSEKLLVRGLLPARLPEERIHDDVDAL